MKKLIIFLGVLSFARINPFVPVITPQNTLVVKRSFFKNAEVYLPDDARVLKKIVFVYQTVNGDIKQKTLPVDKSIDFHKPILIKHTYSKFPMRTLNFLNLFKMYIKEKKIFIYTKDKMIRNFFLIKPFRIVVDFKKDADFLTIKKDLKNSFVKKVVVGNHDGYYRVVIYFDTKYMYKLKKVDEGIKIEIE